MRSFQRENGRFLKDINMKMWTEPLFWRQSTLKHRKLLKMSRKKGLNPTNCAQNFSNQVPGWLIQNYMEKDGNPTNSLFKSPSIKSPGRLYDVESTFPHPLHRILRVTSFLFVLHQNRKQKLRLNVKKKLFNYNSASGWVYV